MSIMRIIEKKMLNAIKNRENFTLSNTIVQQNENNNTCIVLLHGFTIAKIDYKNSIIELSNCGYYTNTTKSRLNTLLYLCIDCIGIYQKDFSWYYRINGKSEPYKNNKQFNIQKY